MSRGGEISGLGARNTQFFQSIAIAVAEVVLSAGLLTGIGIWLTRHLYRLTRLSDEVARGNFTPDTAPEGDDDIGKLGAAFNAMSRTIRDRIDELTIAIKLKEDAEHELRKSEHRFRDLAGSASDWFWETDARYRLTFVSERIDSVLKVGAKAILGFSWFEIGLDDDPGMAELHRAVINGQVPFRDLIFSIGSRDESDFRIILISGLPVFDQDHSFLGYRGVGIDITREALAEQNAARSRQQLDDAIESVADAIAVYDTENRLVICNRAYIMGFGGAYDVIKPGVSFESVLRIAQKRAILFVDETEFEKWLTDRLEWHRKADGQPFTVRRPDRWMQIRDTPTREGGVVTVATDITQLKEREAELDTLRRRYALILDSANEGIIGLDESGKVTFANRMAATILALPAGAMVGKPILSLVQPALVQPDRSVEESPILAACRNGVPTESGAETFCTGTGKELPVDYVVSPMYDQDRVAGAVLLFRDATLRLQYEWTLANQQQELSRQVADRTAELQKEIYIRTRYETELRVSQNRLKAITDSLVEGVMLIDRHGRLAFTNASACHLLQCPRNKTMLGQPLDTFMRLRTPAGIVDFADSPWMSVLTENVTLRNDDAVFDLPDGKNVPVAYACVSLASEDQERFIVVSFRDIGTLKQAQWEMLQSSRLASVGQLAAGIAHEINTPTQYIGDNLSYIRDGLKRLRQTIEAARELADGVSGHPGLTPALTRFRDTMATAKVGRVLEELPGAIDESLEGVARIAHIVLSMKEFSHPGTTVKTATDINRALESTLTVSRNAWKQVAEVEQCFDPALPKVVCHGGEMNQVYLNLILNAAQAIEMSGKPLPGRIVITTRAAAGWVEVIVADNGPGVPKASRDRIFDMFYTTKEVGKGTGQGLAICRDVVVNKHGGSLELSDALDGGAIFTVRVPVNGEYGNTSDAEDW
ncbi:MAG: PAS-domain containing protein [Alphaproteobacteria bacterium]|nr:PAS-domain containing protein [Alphaproteobacteria bacterium]